MVAGDDDLVVVGCTSDSGVVSAVFCEIDGELSADEALVVVVGEAEGLGGVAL